MSLRQRVSVCMRQGLAEKESLGGCCKAKSVCFIRD